jgi:N-methylhydantoinase A
LSKDGTVLEHLDLEATDATIQKIITEGIESVAICLLFSFLNPDHEQAVHDRLLARSGAEAPFLSLSSDVLPEYREYERTSTTVINAYVAPLLSRYIAGLEEGLAGRRLRIMQSNGGMISAEAASRQAARTAFSGPAGGVVGGFELAKNAGFEQAITFDMGGTSTDVSLCPGKIQQTAEGEIAGLPLRLPIIDIHTVGAGGGSIARPDEGGALRVGPDSAGSNPGPVCYGREGAQAVTVTDANLVLGRLDAEHFLGGRMTLDLARARTQMQSLARRLSLPLEAAAWGVIRVANSNMERAIRTISVERGHDPRRFTLVAFGGAGPLHACELAAALRIPRVLIPPHPGVLSALGMVLADVTKDYSQTVMLTPEEADARTLGELLAPLSERAREELLAEGLQDSQINLMPSLDMRYVGQSYELGVPVSAQPGGSVQQYVELFHKVHQQRFSYASQDDPVEIVNLRVKAVGKTDKPQFQRQPLGGVDPRQAHIGYKQVHFADASNARAARPIPAALYQRERLVPGNIVVGPAVLFQFDTTTIVPGGWNATVDEWGNLVVEDRAN